MGRSAEPRPADQVASGVFGSDSVVWVLDAAGDPTLLAASFLQHRLVHELRGRRGGHLSGSELAEVAGSSSRTSSRNLSGERFIGLNDLLAWAAATGLDLLDALPTDVADLLPPGAPALDPSWTVGSGHPMRYAESPASFAAIDWRDIAAGISRWVDEESAAGRRRLLTAGVLRYRLIERLTHMGTLPGGLHLEGGIVVDGLWAESPAEILFALVAELNETQERPAAQAAAAALLETALALGAADADHRVLLVAVSQSLSERLMDLAEDLGQDRRRLPYDRLRRLLPVAAAETTDLEVEVLAELPLSGGGQVLVWRVEKLAH